MAATIRICNNEESNTTFNNDVFLDGSPIIFIFSNIVFRYWNVLYFLIFFFSEVINFRSYTTNICASCAV